MLSTETQLRERISDLEAQVAYWKEEAKGRLSSDRMMKLRNHYGITQAMAWLLEALYVAGGSVVKTSWLEAYMPGHSVEDRSANVVQVQLSRLRRVIGKDLIVNERGEGYRLTPLGVTQINHVISTNH